MTLLWSLWLATFAAGAQEPHLRAVLEQPRCVVGETLLLELQVIGLRLADPMPLESSWSDAEGLRISLGGPARDYSEIEAHGLAGQPLLVFPLEVVALRPGVLEIPPLQVRVEELGTTLYSDPVALEATARRDAPPWEITVLPALPFVGQTLMFELDLHATASNTSNSFPPLALTVTSTFPSGVWREATGTLPANAALEVFLPRSLQALEASARDQWVTIPLRWQEVGGEKSSAPTIWRTSFRFDPNLDTRETSAADRVHGFEVVLFRSAQKGQDRVELARRRREVTMASLPMAGRPESFTGAVGHFALTAQLEARAGVADEAELVLRIQGQGNLGSFGLPDLALDGNWLDLLQESSQQEDVLTIRHRLRQAPGAPARLPALDWSYFDPQTRRYVPCMIVPLPWPQDSSHQAGAQTPTEPNQSPALWWWAAILLVLAAVLKKKWRRER